MASIKYCKQRCTGETKWNLKKSTKLTVKTFICISKTKAFKETDTFPDQGKKSYNSKHKRWSEQIFEARKTAHIKLWTQKSLIKKEALNH